MGLHEASHDLKGLAEILNLKSEEVVEHAIHSPNKYCEKWKIKIKCPRRRNRMPASDSGLTAQQEMNRVMVEIINRLKTEMEDPVFAFKISEIDFHFF